jgi:hypothetical protein
MNKTLKSWAIGAIVFVCSLKVSCWVILNVIASPNTSCTILDAEIYALLFTAAVTTIVMILRSRYVSKKTSTSHFPAAPVRSSRHLSR